MTKRGGWFFKLISAVLFCYAAAPADSPADSGKGRVELPEGVVLRPYAYAHMEAGSIMKGSLKSLDAGKITPAGNYNIYHVWTEDALVSFGFAASYREYLKMVFGLSTKLYFSYPVLNTARYTKNSRQDVAIDDAFAQYQVGDAGRPRFLAQAGYFKFKYNPDVRNLGEYLFRTGTYPISFDMWFDFPQQRLLGFHVQDNFRESLKLDWLFVSATTHPTMNWSLAGLVSYDVAKRHCVEIGAGVDFANLISVYTDSTFPVMFGGDPTTPGGDVNARYIDENGDTNYYTFKGTKIMGRISVDPKPFLPWKIFGKDDLKLYAEADLIGAKSYPDSGFPAGSPLWGLTAPSYDQWLEKLPVAVGFNFPTFKLLDILNLEVEWFGANYYNDASLVINLGSRPLPYDVNNPDTTLPVKSHLKWSVYAKKSFFGGHFAITGQVGRDHQRLQCANYDEELYNELLVTSKDWWWVLKTSWEF